MSLLDDVSIVVTPNGYKAGELYAVVPVPTEGAEEITNGDFSSGSTGWTIINGTVTDKYNASMTSYQSGIRVTPFNKTGTFKVTFDLVVTSGSCKFDAGGANNQIFTTSGAKEILVINTSKFEFNAFNLGWVGTLDNVSVKEWTGADMDVTRATAATRVDEDGLVNYAEVVSDTELVTNGDFANGSTDWTLQNGWALGSNDMVFTPSASSYRKLYQLNFLTIGKHYKLSFEIKSISAGSIANFEPNSPSFNTVGVKTQVFTATFGDLYLEPTTDANLTIDNVSIKEVTRDNVPRIDYTGGGCPHILAEPQRTNLIPYSEAFGSWHTLNNVTITQDTTETTSPSGTNNASKILVSSASTPRRLFEVISTSSGSDYTFTLYAKKGTTDFIRVYFSSSIIDISFDLTNGTKTVTAGTGSIESVGNDWYRIQGTGTSSLTTEVPQIQLSNSASVNDYLYIWGSQLEEGSYATSYIPTSGSTVTRNQDIFTRDGIGSLIGQTEGTFFIELSKPVLNPDNYILISLNNAADNSDNNSVTIGFDNNSDDFYLRLKAGGSIIYVDNSRNSLADTFYKIAIAYKSGASLIYIDGSPITPNSGSLTGAFSFSETLDNLSFDYDGNNGLPFYGNVRQLQVYDTALTDEQLLQLTGESGTDFYESYAEMASALTYTIQ